MAIAVVLLLWSLQMLRNLRLWKKQKATGNETENHLEFLFVELLNCLEERNTEVDLKNYWNIISQAPHLLEIFVAIWTVSLLSYLCVTHNTHSKTSNCHSFLELIKLLFTVYSQSMLLNYSYKHFTFLFCPITNKLYKKKGKSQSTPKPTPPLKPYSNAFP